MQNQSRHVAPKSLQARQHVRGSSKLTTSNSEGETVLDSSVDLDDVARECVMQRLRRSLTKHFSIFHGKAAQFDEAKARRNLRYSYALGIRGQKGPSRFSQPQHPKMPARRKAVNSVKCLAKRPLAYRKGPAQGRHVQRLVQMCESQTLCLFDEIAARVAFPSEGRFLNDCEPLINVHRSTCTRENDLAGATSPQPCAQAILSLGAAGGFSRSRGRRGAWMSGVDFYAGFSASADVGDASNPTRSAIETASAND
jgi:hypothetical protein